VKLRELAAGQYLLEGSVTAADAPAIRDSVDVILARELTDADTIQEFDLSAVVDGNSLLIGLMMGWLREAQRHEKRISYRAVPGRLYELIEFYGLDGVLPVVDSLDVN
jgi:ABC-type transporter Mla MlaB component